MKRFAYASLVCASVLLSPLTAFADLPSWLRTENGHVEDGSALLTKGDAKGALAEFDKAARQLPEDTGVQLDRGLALLKLGELAKAREALVSATGGSGQPSVRADAYQNLALAFYRDGDALAGQKKHEEAQQMFQEALDAAKRSLRLRPGDPNAAWNLELASRRLREEKAKKQAEDDKKKQDQKDDQKKPDDQNKDQQQQDPSAKNDQDKDQNKDQQKPGEQGKQPDSKDAKNDAQKPPEPKPDKDKQQAQPKPQEAKAADTKQGPDGQGEKGEEKPLPKDVEQALDSLKDGEQNFERLRARQRAQQENRAPEKDW